MNTRVWTPINPDGTINEAELRRPAETAEPTTWEVAMGADWHPDLDDAVYRVTCAVPNAHVVRLLFPAASKIERRCRVVMGRVFGDYEMTAHHMGEDVVLAAGPISTQDEADVALPALLKVKAARREAVFAPTEPIDFAEWIFCDECREGPYGPGAIEDRLNNAMGGKPWRECGCSRLDAVRVCGGAPEHVASLRAQCEAAGVEFAEKA